MKAAHIVLGLLLTVPWFAGPVMAVAPVPSVPCVLTTSTPSCAIACQAGVTYTLQVFGGQTHGAVSCPGGPDSHCAAPVYCTAKSSGNGIGRCYMFSAATIAICN